MILTNFAMKYVLARKLPLTIRPLYSTNNMRIEHFYFQMFDNLTQPTDNYENGEI